MAGDSLTAWMEWELTLHLGRKRYERREGGSNHRNGSYPRRFTMKGIGEVEIKVPRDRQGSFKTAVLPKGWQYEEALAQDLSLLFLAGLSSRSLAMLSRRLVGRKLSHTEISNANKGLHEAVEKWRTRDLSQEKIQYLFVDGVNFDMRIVGTVDKVPVLVVIGVNDQGIKMVLGLQAGDKESASAWRELFKDLKQRGLDKDQVRLGVMDGLPGLEKVFKKEFRRARLQRCQVHVARNVLAKEVVSYAKNHNLGFAIPYTLDGEEKNYYPDFLVRLKVDGREEPLNLIIEVTGEKKKEKATKVAAARNLWVPAVNNHGGYGQWAFLEIADPWDAQNLIRAFLANLPRR